MRFHMSLPVTNIPETVAFYRTLFGSEPVKQKEDYAKFLPPTTALNISFHQSPDAIERVRAVHVGFEVEDRAELERVHARLEAAGLISTPRATGVCCYANQDKFWITDPDGYQWEVYFLLADTAQKMDIKTDCCAASGEVEQRCC